jgi:hypothetical protein
VGYSFKHDFNIIYEEKNAGWSSYYLSYEVQK